MSANAIGAGVPVQQKKRSMKGRIIGAIGLLVVAAIVAVGSGANFTAHSANPGNMITEGTFSISNNHEGQALFDPQVNFDPGDQVAGQVTIGNSGNEGGDFTLRGVSEPGNDVAFNDKVRLDVYEYTNQGDALASAAALNGGNSADVLGQGLDSTSYRFGGTLAEFIAGTCAGASSAQCSPAPGARFNLSRWGAGNLHHYVFRVRNQAPGGDTSDPNVLAWQGKTAKFGIEWDAVSAA